MMDEQGSNGGDQPESLLPYELWTEEAFRSVAIRALSHVAVEGLPGDHHFYVTFRTDHPQTVLPARLRAKYPEEMTIVLQHKFWDLTIDDARRFVSVGLSFGGVSSTLGIPFDALIGFADPSVKWGLRFRPIMPEMRGRPALRAVEDGAVRLAVVSDNSADDEGAEPDAQKDGSDPDAPDAPEAGPPSPQVVSLDTFRKRKD